MVVGYSSATCARPSSQRSRRPHARRGEEGYALIGLLAVMTIMAMVLVSAVPNVRRQAQRSLEEEAIWRGEQVQEAIRQYVNITKRLPNSIEELQEGAPRGTKKVQVLRRSAAIDPLSSSGEWKMVKRTDRAFIDFQGAVMAYAGRQVKTNDAGFLQAAGGEPPPMTNVLDIGSADEAPGDEDTTDNSPGPFVGVSSRSRRNSIIAYYGIERHDRWVFTPFFR